MPIQTCSKPAVSSLVGLVILATIAPATLSCRHTRASHKEPVLIEDPQDGPKPPSLVKDEERALAEFLDTYRLAPGQDLKRVPPPRPEGVRVWDARKNPGRAGPGRLDDVRAMVFGWRGPDQLQLKTWMFGDKEGWSIRTLPQSIAMGIDPSAIEGDAELLKTKVSGDWIVREGVPAEQLIPPLEAILQRAVRQRITLTLRRVERDVVVVRGRYRAAPLPGHGEGEIEIYARELDPDGEEGSGAGTFPSFLKGVGEWIGRPIVDEVESPPRANVRWHYNERDPSTERTRRGDGDEALVLKHLQEQTGLTFARENSDPDPIRRACHCKK